MPLHPAAPGITRFVVLEDGRASAGGLSDACFRARPTHQAHGRLTPLYALQQQGIGVRRSAPEVVKIAEDAFASLVLDGTLPPEASGALLYGLRGLLLRYAEAVAAQLSCTGLVPPLPPLVRYKREVVVKAEAVGAGRAPNARLVLTTVSAIPYCGL